MFSFHKPKIYRSLTGCCICRAKSSSSRFTDSTKYEVNFGLCFRLKEERSGDICNACVLLVKRFRKLPTGLQRHWGHVVDARASTKTRPKMADKAHAECLDAEEDDDDEEDDDEDILPMKRQRKCRRRRPKWPAAAAAAAAVGRPKSVACKNDNLMPGFLDPTLWNREEVCCGTIFRGPMNAIVIDVRYFRPCRRGSSDDSSSSSSSSSPGSRDASLHLKIDSMHSGNDVNDVESGNTSCLAHCQFENQSRSKMAAVPAAL